MENKNMTNVVNNDGAVQAVVNSIYMDEMVDTILNKEGEPVIEMLKGQDIDREALIEAIAIEALDEADKEAGSTEETKKIKFVVNAQIKGWKEIRKNKQRVLAECRAIQNNSNWGDISEAERKDAIDYQLAQIKAENKSAKEAKEKAKASQPKEKAKASQPKEKAADKNTEGNKKKLSKKERQAIILAIVYDGADINADIYISKDETKYENKKLLINFLQILCKKIQERVASLKTALDAGKIDEIKSKYNIA